MKQQGLFITFEGIEGSGKSTQVQLLAEALDKDVIVTREPGGTPISERIREIFLNSDRMTIQTELLLIAAARSQHVEEVIRPALEANKTVICDRFTDSTLAYQWYRGDADIDLIMKLNEITTEGITPDITFLLDIPPEIGLIRQQEDVITRDRIDRESLESHRKVREGYRAIAKSNHSRITFIDAAQPVKTIHSQIIKETHRVKTRIDLG